MAFITHAEIVGTRMAEEGSGGYTVNSTSYSVLIFYSDGTVNLVEGSANQIRPYLPFMRPRSDFNQLQPMLEQLEAKLEASIKKTVNTSINDLLYETRNPLPKGLTGTSGQDAKVLLEKAGFKVEFYPLVPAGTTGTVLECVRKENDPMTAILKMKYDMPSIVGMDADVAIEKLKSAGFSPTIKMIRSEGTNENNVINVVRDNDSLDVLLYVCQNTSPEEYAFERALEQATCMMDIWKIWKDSDLAERYPEISKKLWDKKEIERMYGKSDNNVVEQFKIELKNKLNK